MSTSTSQLQTRNAGALSPASSRRLAAEAQSENAPSLTHVDSEAAGHKARGGRAVAHTDRASESNSETAPSESLAQLEQRAFKLALLGPSRSLSSAPGNDNYHSATALPNIKEGYVSGDVTQATLEVGEPVQVPDVTHTVRSLLQLEVDYFGAKCL